MSAISSTKFEQLVCQYTNGRIIGVPADIESGNRTQLEAKVSNAEFTGPGRKRCKWTRLRGTNGQQRYDRLIVGANFYSELVYFDIPFEWILAYTIDNPWRLLYCSEFYGPYSISGTAAYLWYNFKSSPTELLERYG